MFSDICVCFCANFSSLLMSVFIVFLPLNVVCCVLLVQYFCANCYFSCCFSTFVWFSIVVLFSVAAFVFFNISALKIGFSLGLMFCFFQHFCVKSGFSYWLLSFACFFQYFCAKSLLFVLFAEFCVVFNSCLIFCCCVCFFSALNRCFLYCLLSFARLDGLSYVMWVACFFLSCLLRFSCLDAFSPFLPCLSKTKLSGGLARAGAARRRWKSGLWAFGVFLAVEICGRRDYGLFFVGMAAFLMERKRNCAGTVRRFFVGPCDFCLFFRVVHS